MSKLQDKKKSMRKEAVRKKLIRKRKAEMDKLKKQADLETKLLEKTGLTFEITNPIKNPETVEKERKAHLAHNLKVLKALEAQYLEEIKTRDEFKKMMAETSKTPEQILEMLKAEAEQHAEKQKGMKLKGCSECHCIPNEPNVDPAEVVAEDTKEN